MKSLLRPGPALLRELYELREPIISVYFRMEDPAADDVAVRRRVIRHRLLRATTGRAALTAMEKALSQIPQGPGTVAAFVGRDGAAHTFDMPGVDMADRVSRASVPDVVPFLKWRQYRPPYVFAVLDPAGAVVSVRNSPWANAMTTRVSEGSMPQDSSYTVQTVSEALSSSGARLLILAGDATTLRNFNEKLPRWVRDQVRIQTLPAGGEQQESTGHQWSRLAGIVAEMVDAGLREAVADMAGSSSSTGLGVQGIPAVIDALADGQVDELLIGPGADATAWFGSGPTDIARHHAELAVPDGDKRHGPVADVMIRAATLTDAETAVLPLEMSEMLRDGVGAIRRPVG